MVQNRYWRQVVFVCCYSLSLAAYSQAKQPIDLSFTYVDPKYNRPIYATNYLWERYTNVAKLVSDYSHFNCLQTLGQIRFRVEKTGVIDQVQVTSKAFPDYLPGMFRDRLEASKPYWTCADCETKGPVSITVPVFIQFEVGCRGKQDSVYTNHMLGTLLRFPSANLLPILGIQTGDRSLMLYPILLESIR
ncbi:hypothetical protein FAES_0496 [Fibrella aestuarina BUZ 2]|uniref:TonB C-terminal domain-containing protein n=1 Tax=Fibrella aestuarina BUZ 2 TaxID=1166018 RepID=I0K304_9BACT|nr:hypothetical protein [Fibrella aestuarina]CCG98507.1 hypothetical protein FAES_0496 [Fibrella aestuarina BUZ 2]